MVDTDDDRWCILRTAGARTLPLAASLNDAGIEAWTPVGKSVRRHGKNRAKVKVACPIMPTFVFARVRHLSELEACRALPVNPHPAFSIFRHYGAIPKISDAALEAIRTEERRQTPRAFPKGSRLTVPEGSFAGLTGIIEGTEGKLVMVLFRGFGGDVIVKIDACDIPDDAIEQTASNQGTAARAA